MASKTLLKAVFNHAEVALIQGDVETHCFHCPHTVVELRIDGDIAYTWMYEHTHPMNEIEAYWRFGQECRNQMASQERRADAPGALEGATVVLEVAPRDGEPKN